uniref:ATP synthase F0 subunit 8 n=1 Tax=Glaucias dorsalis TaxID=2880902 RepID=UPI001D0FD290|nr:ATP synthase F0 subunit 8 [Glaucias dorsalis]UCC46003.1 ATP synthase F0 subunit 8 [Glaucias dorsalis]
MPQMAPLWWEILFLMFIMSFIMMSIMIYFLNNIMIKNKNISNKININQLNWPW